MTEPAPRAFFLLRWWTWPIVVLTGALMGVVLIAFPAAEWTRDGALLALIAGSCFAGCLLLSTLLWWWSHGARSIFQWVFLSLWGSCLMTIFIVAREAQYEHDVALVEQIEETRLALRQQSIERAKQTLAELAERRERMKEDRFLRYEGHVSPDLLEQMRAVDAEILGALDKASDRYAATIEANDLGGPETWLRVATLDELETLRARNQAVYEAARAYNDFLDGMEGRYVTELEKLALPPPADRFAIAEMERFLQYWDRSGARDIRRLDSEITGIALRALDLLRDRWEEWSFDRTNSRVRFATAGLELQFAQLLGEAEMLSREQQRLIREREKFDRRVAEGE